METWRALDVGVGVAWGGGEGGVVIELSVDESMLKTQKRPCTPHSLLVPPCLARVSPLCWLLSHGCVLCVLLCLCWCAWCPGRAPTLAFHPARVCCTAVASYRDEDDVSTDEESSHGEVLLTMQTAAGWRGMVVDSEGRRTSGGGMRAPKFSSAPSQLLLSPGHPYLLSLQGTCVEVHNTTTERAFV